MNNPTPACAQCGSDIHRPVGARGPAPKHCSPACKASARKAREQANGVAQRREQKARENRDSAKAERPTPPCPYCGTPMDNVRRKQCGAEDCKRKFNADRARDWFRNYTTKTGQRYASKLRTHTCTECGKTWQSYSLDSQFCGNECKWKPVLRERAAKAEAAAKQIMVYQPLPWWARPAPRQLKPLRRRWYMGECMRCNDAFITDHPRVRTCSARCAKKVGKERRRAIQAGAFVEPVYRQRIFERDGWRCMLCRRPVSRDAVVPNPMAPTIDHVIPLAAGGTHEPANVQCAHYLCNCAKSDRGGGEQLALIG